MTEYTLEYLFGILNSSVIGGFLIAFTVLIIGLTVHELLKLIKKA